MRDFELELELAAQENEQLQCEFSSAESETGRGAATALLQLLHAVEGNSGLTTLDEQQAALRVGLAQLDAANNPLRGVGIPGVIRKNRLNKPDLSYIFNDTSGSSPVPRRMNVEIDTNPNESQRHQTIVNRRDPNARNLYVVVHPWTGEIISARVREPGKTAMSSIPKSQFGGLFQGLPQALRPSASSTAKRPARVARLNRSTGRSIGKRLHESEFENELETAAHELEQTFD